MNACTSRGCSRERDLTPGSEGRCGDCWREDEEHEEYQKKWYEYWNSRGKNYEIILTPRRYAV